MITFDDVPWRKLFPRFSVRRSMEETRASSVWKMDIYIYMYMYRLPLFRSFEGYYSVRIS